MMNEESLRAWEQEHIEILTSREMGEWLYRRDKNRDSKERPQVGWVRREDVIHSIAKQYSDHNELVPIWLSIGDIKGGDEE